MRLMFVGDLSMGEHFFSFGHGPRSVVECGENPLKYCSLLFQKADLVVGNLEGPVSDDNYDSNTPVSRVFRGAESTATMLKSAGVSVVNIANNHAMQHGAECFHKTIQLLEESGILVIGKSRQIEPWAIKIVNGQRIGFIGASAIKEPYYQDNTYRQFELEEILQDTKALRALCDVLVMSLHWGLENKTHENESMREFSSRIFAAGADLIAGHHSHIFSPIQLNNGKLVAYSLGDFVFDLPWSKQLTQTAVLDINIDSNNCINSVSCWPFKLSWNGIPKSSSAEVVVFNNDSKETDLYFDLYKYQKLDSFLPIRKLIFFLIMIPFGATRVKLTFLKWKIKQRMIKIKNLMIKKFVRL